MTQYKHKYRRCCYRSVSKTVCYQRERNSHMFLQCGVEIGRFSALLQLERKNGNVKNKSGKMREAGKTKTQNSATLEKLKKFAKLETPKFQKWRDSRREEKKKKEQGISNSGSLVTLRKGIHFYLA